MLYGPPDLVPERAPALTPAGKPTLRRRTKSDRNHLYLRSLASNVLATVKEGLAVCPGLAALTVLVVRREPGDSGEEQLAAVYAGSFRRETLTAVDWRGLDTVAMLEAPEDSYIELKGQAHEVAPLDLTDEPELETVLEHLARVLGIAPLAPKPRRGQRADAASRPERRHETASIPDHLEPAQGAGHGSPSATRPTVLAEQLADGDPDVRYDAVTALRERRDPGLLGPLTRAVEDRDRHVRRQAVGALSDLSDPRCRPLLTRLLEDSDADVRWEAIAGLREILDSSLLPALKRAVDDDDRYVRRAAVSALSELGHVDVRPIMRALASDQDVDVRFEAISVLSNEPTAEDGPMLAAATGDQDRYLRQTALRGLGELGDRQYLDEVAALLRDPDVDVRYQAATSLGELRGHQAEAALRAAVRDPDADVRMAVASALERASE